MFTTLQLKKKSMIVKVSTVQTLCICLFIMQVDILKKKNGNKYLIFDDSVNESKELLKKWTDAWYRIKNKIKTINGGKENDYGRYYKKINFNSDDELPLIKPPKFHAVTIIMRSVFEEGGKLCPQVFLDDALYEL